MVVNIEPHPTQYVEATRYVKWVAGGGAALLLALLLLGRRWCRARCSAQPRAHLVHALDRHADALSKPIHYPDRIFTFEATDSDEELRLQIHQDDGIECRYEEKNENKPGAAGAAGGGAGAVRPLEAALRETRIGEAPAPAAAPATPAATPAALHLRALEAQSSVDSDVLAHNDTSLLCGAAELAAAPATLDLSFLYDAPVRSMTVHVLQARCLPRAAPDAQSQIRILLLPSKKQKYKTKIRCGENAQYMESFVFHKINPEDVHGLSLRVRAYGCARMRRQRLLGEAVVQFAGLQLEHESGLRVPLLSRGRAPQLPSAELARVPAGALCASPASSAPTPALSARGEAGSLARSDSASSCGSARSTPELLLGLAYSAVTGHLSVEVIKGTHFRKLSPTPAPDTYVKLCLVSSLGLEMGRCKSSTRRAQSNPLYKELFIFQVALYQLSEVTLMVSVWWRRSVKRNEMVGWFSLGLNSSGQEEAQHWQEACEARADQIQRWHLLLDS